MKYHTVITLGYHTLVLSNYLGRVVGGGGVASCPCVRVQLNASLVSTLYKCLQLT